MPDARVTQQVLHITGRAVQPARVTQQVLHVTGRRAVPGRIALTWGLATVVSDHKDEED